MHLVFRVYKEKNDVVPFECPVLSLDSTNPSVKRPELKDRSLFFGIDLGQTNSIAVSLNLSPLIQNDNLLQRKASLTISRGELYQYPQKSKGYKFCVQNVKRAAQATSQNAYQMNRKATARTFNNADFESYKLLRKAE